jgi:hypothetical protein
MAGKAISVSARLYEDEQKLLSQALNTLIWFEQDTILQFARDHIYVPDGNGGAKKFEGSYLNLVTFFETQPGGRLHSMDRLDRTMDAIRTLHKKLLPNHELPANIAPITTSKKSG